MTNLNLTANGKSQELILAYLQENASDILAEKINNGTPIKKDGKNLINKKDLDGFMKYAADEARKLAAKGARDACVEDSIVYGWAIHYFEEESIEGKLYNSDGTEYKATVKATSKPEVKKVEISKPTQQQASLFDMLDTQPKAQEKSLIPLEEDNDDEEDDQPTPEEVQEILAEIAEQDRQEQTEPKKGSPMYQHYMNIQAHYKDCVIAYRLGDFYKVFGDNAVKIANELNLTLTGRDCGLDERVPMIGFPYHAAEVYFSKIIGNGHKLAVAEDINTVREFVKDTSEKLIDKDTGEIIDTSVQSDDDILAREREIAKAFDKEALIKLSDLLGDIFILN